MTCLHTVVREAGNMDHGETTLDKSDSASVRFMDSEIGTNVSLVTSPEGGPVRSLRIIRFRSNNVICKAGTPFLACLIGSDVSS